jgi:hypothetical protein
MHKLVWTTRGMHQNILKRHGGLQRIRQWAFGDLARRRNLELEDGITKEQLSSSKTDDWPKFWLPAGIFSNMYECPQGVLMSTTLKRKAIVFMLIWSNSNRFLIHIQGNCLSGEKTVSIIFRVTFFFDELFFGYSWRCSDEHSISVVILVVMLLWRCGLLEIRDWKIKPRLKISPHWFSENRDKIGQKSVQNSKSEIWFKTTEINRFCRKLDDFLGLLNVFKNQTCFFKKCL